MTDDSKNPLREGLQGERVGCQDGNDAAADRA